MSQYVYTLLQSEAYDNLGERVRDDLEVLLDKLNKPSVHAIVQSVQGKEVTSFKVESLECYDTFGETMRDAVEPIAMDIDLEVHIQVIHPDLLECFDCSTYVVRKERWEQHDKVFCSQKCCKKYHADWMEKNKPEEQGPMYNYHNVGCGGPTAL